VGSCCSSLAAQSVGRDPHRGPHRSALLATAVVDVTVHLLRLSYVSYI
jgi:hypothetical protein